MKRVEGVEDLNSRIICAGLNPHRARGTDGALPVRDFVPWRFSDAGLRACRRSRHCDKQPFPARRASNNAMERRYRAPVPLIR